MSKSLRSIPEPKRRDVAKRRLAGSGLGMLGALDYFEAIKGKNNPKKIIQ